jgi:hypothetical protein
MAAAIQNWSSCRETTCGKALCKGWDENFGVEDLQWWGNATAIEEELQNVENGEFETAVECEEIVCVLDGVRLLTVEDLRSCKSSSNTSYSHHR